MLSADPFDTIHSTPIMQALITVTRRTIYTSIVEMDQATYDRLDQALLEGSRSKRIAAENELNGLINVGDWQGDELDQLETFEPYVPTVEAAP